MDKLAGARFIISGQPYDGTLHYETVGEVVYSNLPEPDPDWRYRDAQGHEHRWVKTDHGAYTTPTLERVVVATYWCEDCHEEHEETHLACRICGEVVEPGSRPPSPFGTWVTNQVNITATVDGLIADGDVHVRLGEGRYVGHVVAVEMRHGELAQTTLSLVPEPSP